MSHPLVDQLRFTRREFQRALEGVTEEDARRRFLPMNCISWSVGHLAWQEQRYFVHFGQGKMLLPHLNDLFAFGAAANVPSLAEMRDAWTTVTRAADPWLDTLTTDDLLGHVVRDGEVTDFLFGSLVQRVTYHYWYHTGENMAVRQMLGQTDLPQFVGDLDEEAPYRVE